MLNTTILTDKNIHLVYELHATGTPPQHCSKMHTCINSFKNLLVSELFMQYNQ